MGGEVRLLAAGQLRGLLACLGGAESWAARYDASGTFASTTSCLSPGSCTTRSGRRLPSGPELWACPLWTCSWKSTCAQHACCLHHPAQLDLAPLAAGAVGAQGRLERMRGPQQLLIGQAGLLQLLGELAVLLQPVAFEQGHLLLHGGELFRHRAPAHGAHCRRWFRDSPSSRFWAARRRRSASAAANWALTSDSRADTPSKSCSTAR